MLHFANSFSDLSINKIKSFDECKVQINAKFNKLEDIQLIIKNCYKL